MKQICASEFIVEIKLSQHRHCAVTNLVAKCRYTILQ